MDPEPQDAPPDAEAAAPPLIDSRPGFHAALQWGLEAAVQEQARRIVFVDADFAEWPLDKPELLATLAAWLRLPQRRLVLLARDYAGVARRCPRFNAWRSNWMHAIEAWQPPEDLAGELPCLLLSDGRLSVQLFDAQHWRGRVSQDERRARQWRDEIDAVLQRSERSWAVRTLGL